MYPSDLQAHQDRQEKLTAPTRRRNFPLPISPTRPISFFFHRLKAQSTSRPLSRNGTRKEPLPPWTSSVYRSRTSTATPRATRSVAGRSWSAQLPLFRLKPSSMRLATLCLATRTKATLQTQNVHHGISGKWKPRPFPCCAVNPLACRGRSTAVVISNHGAKARHSASVPPNASFTPPTKSFAQAIRANETPRKNGGWLTRSASRHCVIGSHICRPVKKSWQAGCTCPLRLLTETNCKGREELCNSPSCLNTGLPTPSI